MERKRAREEEGRRDESYKSMAVPDRDQDARRPEGKMSVHVYVRKPSLLESQHRGSTVLDIRIQPWKKEESSLTWEMKQGRISNQTPAYGRAACIYTLYTTSPESVLHVFGCKLFIIKHD